MDLVTAVVFCNCTIAIVIVILTISTIRLRRYIVAVAKWCDRWDREWDQLLSSDVPGSQPLGARLAASQANMVYLRQSYQQQLQTLDRIQSVMLFLGVTRSLFLKRRRY